MLISSENISGINLVCHIIQIIGVSVCNNTVRPLLECLQIIDDLAAEECTPVHQRRFIYNDLRTLRFDAFHDSLD